MALSEEYRKQALEEIRDGLDKLKHFPSPEGARRLWKAGPGIEFHYGMWIGGTVARLITNYHRLYGEPPSGDAAIEITALVRGHVDELRAILLELESRDDHPPEDHEP